MTRKRFQTYFALIAIVYGLFLFSGLCLKFRDSSNYELFKDLIPIATALPAAILAGIYQRRGSFLQQIRSSWMLLIEGIQEAIQFTHLEDPTPEDKRRTFKALSLAIDDFRSLYKNLKEGRDSEGYFPYESLKKIESDLGHYCKEKQYESQLARMALRRSIITDWKRVRVPVLEEFDRVEPTYFDSPYVDNKNEEH